MSTEARIYDESYAVAADLQTHQHKFVKFNGANTVDVCGANEVAVGVLQNDPDNDPAQAAEVRHLGISLLVVNGQGVNIAAGDILESVAAGIGVKCTTDKHNICAIALQAATADGVKISVLLLGPRQASL
jgi:hypothetical protein